MLEEKFENSAKMILGLYFIGRDIEKDLKEGTDFLTFTIKPFKSAFRLRRFYAFLSWPNQFTIRWSLPSGHKTEHQKIMEGYVDYILYGFIDNKEEKVIKYFIGDLNVFREINPKPIGIFDNDPPDSKLAVYKLSQLPPEFILKTVTQL